jgi:CRISPR/Cas system type I-B associated protein Csh2 (Cas7 group RAMP superfamily)
MCSGCSGDYEGDSDGWEPPSGSCFGDSIHGDSFEENSALLQAPDFGKRTHGDARDVARKRRARARRAESEYEVLVSAEEIIEIRRIAGDFADLL